MVRQTGHNCATPKDLTLSMQAACITCLQARVLVNPDVRGSRHTTQSATFSPVPASACAGSFFSAVVGGGSLSPTATQKRLWPPAFQCCVWHAVPQYHTSLHREQALSEIPGPSRGAAQLLHSLPTEQAAIGSFLAAVPTEPTAIGLEPATGAAPTAGEAPLADA